MDVERSAIVETILTAIVAILSVIVIWALISDVSVIIPIIAIIALASVGFIILRYMINPDHVRARQSDRTLYLAGQTLEAAHDGLTEESAERICNLLLPYTAAVAIAITDTEKTLAYAGIADTMHTIGDTIRRPMRAVIADGVMRVLLSPGEIGLPLDEKVLRSAIIVPLIVASKQIGTITFYYHSPRRIDETQQAMAGGLGELLSTQFSAAEVDKQTELATRMELKALQAQINPHFLFNTINTIASLIRTDPEKARMLLREFAVFYRRTLENSEDLIALESELEQTERYFKFEQARFGEDRVALELRIEDGIEKLPVPSFIVQPLVENAVIHAMREEGRLHIVVDAHRDKGGVEITVSDDGVGIPPDVLPHTLDPGYGTGMGVALKNVQDRLKGYFGPLSGITMESVYGDGTTVRLRLGDVTLPGLENKDA